MIHKIKNMLYQEKHLITGRAPTSISKINEKLLKGEINIYSVWVDLS